MTAAPRNAVPRVLSFDVSSDAFDGSASMLPHISASHLTRPSCHFTLPSLVGFSLLLTPYDAIPPPPRPTLT